MEDVIPNNHEDDGFDKVMNMIHLLEESGAMAIIGSIIARKVAEWTSDKGGSQ